MKLCEIPMVVVSMLGFWLLSGIDVPTAHADFTFGTPVSVGPTVNTTESFGPCLSPDGRELYFHRDPGEIWVARRASPDGEWGPPSNLGPTVNSLGYDGGPCISADGLRLYFFSDRAGSFGSVDLWVTRRTAVDDNWMDAVNCGALLNTVADDWSPSLTADGLELYFTSNRSGGYGNWDLWVTTRATAQDAWGVPVNLGLTVNSPAGDNWPGISPDGLLLFFSSTRPGGSGAMELYMARRATTKDPWSLPLNLGPVVNSAAIDNGPKVSVDGSMLYFFSFRAGGLGSGDIWQAPITPIVDLNADEAVGLADLVVLIDNWGTENTLCDIGPMPWGDGVVDAADLEILMSYWGQEIPSPDLIGHWKLDEASGEMAVDAAQGNDGILLGEPLWQPTGGKVAGALQFDGVDDCVMTGFVCNPSADPFSVFAWVRGGAPGQVILSQDKGANWLLVSAPRGELMTELKSGRGGPLLSNAITIDGTWHRVGLVWDGANRILYVDDVEVARDPLAGPAGGTGGLHIGDGSTLASGTFWSGLIDDVRLYKRAVVP